MSTKSANQPPEGTSYTRGMQLGEVDTGRVIGIFLAACLVALIVLTAVLTISVTRQNARADKLPDQGVPVVATVNRVRRCRGQHQCRRRVLGVPGTYSLDANVYNEVIGGNRAQLDTGTKVAAVAVPGSPSLLATAESAAKTASRWTSYATSIVLAGVTVVSIIGFVAWIISRRRVSPPASA